jgi:hypothetical protein
MRNDLTFNNSYHMFAESISRTISATWRNTDRRHFAQITKETLSLLTIIPLVKVVFLEFKRSWKLRQTSDSKLLFDLSVRAHSWHAVKMCSTTLDPTNRQN